MTALALSVLRGIVENGLEMEKVYVYLPQVNSALEHFRLDLASLAYFAPATSYLKWSQQFLMNGVKIG